MGRRHASNAAPRKSSSNRVSPHEQATGNTHGLKGFKLWSHLKRKHFKDTQGDRYDSDEEVAKESIFSDDRETQSDEIAKKYWTPDNMVRMVLLGQEFQIHKNTLRDSDSRTLRRLRPQPGCPYYMPELSEKAEQQTYYLCQQPSAFRAIIMYMEGGLLTPPKDMSLDDFIDEIIFYELYNVDEAIEAYNDRFDSESDTSDSEFEEEAIDREEGGGDARKKESWLRKTQRVTHIIMDGEIEEASEENDKQQYDANDNHHHDYTKWQNMYTIFSTLLVFLSVTTFIMATMPHYRLQTVWACSYELEALNGIASAAEEAAARAGVGAGDAAAAGAAAANAAASAGGDSAAAGAVQALFAAVLPAGEVAYNATASVENYCYVGSPFFQWGEGVVPLETGIGATGYMDAELKGSPVVVSLSGIAYESRNGFVPDNANTTIDNCFCAATERDTLNEMLELIDFACFVYFAAEALVRFLAYRRKKKWFWNVLNWVDVIALVPSIYGLVIWALYSNNIRAIDAFKSQINFTAIGNMYTAGADGSEYDEVFDEAQNVKDSAGALHIFRVVRIVRIARLLRLSRYFVGITIFARAINDSRKALLQLFFMIMTVSIIFATIIFHIEHEDDDPFGTGFESIPSGIWWAIVTMSTLGYGDMVPQHWAGKVFGAVCGLCGILVIALPVPVFVDNFQKLWDAHHLQTNLKQRRKERAKMVERELKAVAAMAAAGLSGSKGGSWDHGTPGRTGTGLSTLPRNRKLSSSSEAGGFRSAEREGSRDMGIGERRLERRSRDGKLKKVKPEGKRREGVGELYPADSASPSASDAVLPGSPSATVSVPTATPGLQEEKAGTPQKSSTVVESTPV